MDTILSKLVQFFLVLLLGVWLAKVKMISEQSLRLLSQLVTKAFLPAFTFCSMYIGNSRKQLSDGVPVLFITFFFYLSIMLLFALLSKIIGIKEERQRTFQALFILEIQDLLVFPLFKAYTAARELFIWHCFPLSTS